MYKIVEMGNRLTVARDRGGKEVAMAVKGQYKASLWWVELLCIRTMVGVT